MTHPTTTACLPAGLVALFLLTACGREAPASATETSSATGKTSLLADDADGAAADAAPAQAAPATPATNQLAAQAGEPAADDGHGPDDGHGHGPDDGHGHGADDGHGDAKGGKKATAELDKKIASTKANIEGLKKHYDETEDAAVRATLESKIQLAKAELADLEAKWAGAAKGSGKSIGKELDARMYGGEVEPNAKLEIEYGTENHDFGRATQGVMLEHVFEMKSGGTAPLVIRQAKPTCGCTLGEVLVEDETGSMVPYVLGEAIEPGRRVQISAALDTKSKNGKTQVRINVYHNDPTTLTQLGLAANVEPFLVVTPPYVNLGDLSADSVKTQSIQIHTSKGDPVALALDDTVKRPKPPGLEISLQPVSPDESGRAARWTVDLQAGPGLAEGPLGYTLTLESDREIDGAEPNPDGNVPVYTATASIGGRVLGVLSCAPQFLSMGLVRPGQVVSRSVRITSHDPNFTLGEVETELRPIQGGDFPWADSFTTIVQPVAGVDDAVDVELRLDGLPDGSDGSFKGELVIHTGHPSKPEIAVAFSGVCRGGIGRPTSTVTGGGK